MEHGAVFKEFMKVTGDNERDASHGEDGASNEPSAAVENLVATFLASRNLPPDQLIASYLRHQY